LLGFKLEQTRWGLMLIRKRALRLTSEAKQLCLRGTVAASTIKSASTAPRLLQPFVSN